MSGLGWPARYEIRVESVWMIGGRSGSRVCGSRTKVGQSILSGTLPDQSALYGILDKIRDLGLSVIAVCRVPSEAEREKK